MLPPIELLPGITPLQAGEVLEILGEPGAGKSSLVMECAARCILPLHAGGNGVRAVVVSTSGGFSLQKLRVALEERLRKPAQSSSADAAAADERAALAAQVDSCLEQLTVLRCAAVASAAAAPRLLLPRARFAPSLLWAPPLPPPQAPKLA